jgi:hypothetical protein
MATAEPRRCLGCDYILDHLPEPRCPECGRPFDPTDPATYWFVGQTERLPAVGWIILAVSAAALPVIAPFAVPPLSDHAGDVVGRVLLIAALPAQAAVFVRSVVAVVSTRRTRGRAVWYAIMGLSLLCLFVYGGCLAVSQVLWTAELPP